MLRPVLTTVAVIALLSGGAFALNPSSSHGPGREELVSANLVRVEVNGRWETFPMVPLSDQACASGDVLFQRYCGEHVLAPAAR